jgi:hypothetical protein
MQSGFFNMSWPPYQKAIPRYVRYRTEGEIILLGRVTRKITCDVAETVHFAIAAARQKNERLVR